MYRHRPVGKTFYDPPSRRKTATTRHSLVCPDCDAVGSGHPTPTIRHRETCAIGRGINAALAADRDYFVAHPGTDVRERALTWAERQQQVALGAPPEALDGARVIVQAVAPGVRVRVIVPAGGCER